ncbi:acyltransferase [Sphingopyxis sp. XHP0097]|uniref:Acyltransferase n=1 Tax=Sphingopyxis jiangsuensis TaxID=2871171 RepID=A0ABS7MIW6_9SPHN|nr:MULTISPECIES: acyltransferase [Sphingopyxis]MBL0768883.1 acyltransferase [Sphingopyxis lutea]MBY4638011.1 acyltransferase [Sphingopyxis jiangsuensis]
MGHARAAPRKLAALDLLRFACAMLVLAAHYFASFARAPSAAAREALSGQDLAAPFASFTWFGWIGVELFFVISGFVIALSARGSGAGQFVRRRILRLAPAAWLCATITALALIWAGIFTPAEVARRWTASTLFLAAAPQIDASYWTLGVEVNFYLLVGLGLWRAGDAVLDVLPKILAFVGALFWTSYLLAGPGPGQPPSLGLCLLLAPHASFFAVGMMLERRARTGALSSPSFFVLALAACTVEIANVTAARMTAMDVTQGFALPFLFFVAGLLVIASADRIAIGTQWLPMATQLGLATYPLYLIHQDAGAVAAAALLRTGMSFTEALLLTTAIVVGFALACTRWLEPVVRARLAHAIDALARRRAAAHSGALPGA